MKNILLNIVMVIFSMAIALATVEFGLGLAGVGSLYKSGISRISHPILKFQLPPEIFSEIDSSGFRNITDKGKFDVVILGDSHSYGYGVTARSSFPVQFSRQTGLTSYNYGMGGYGPAQYANLIDDALRKSKKFVVVALFMGNDMFDACNIANELLYWREYFEALGIATETCGGRYSPMDSGSQTGDASLSRRLKAFIKQTRTGSLLNSHVWLPFKGWLKLIGIWPSNPASLTVDDNTVSTIFGVWPNHTATAAAGLEITKHLLAQITQSAKQKDIVPILLLLPSKQNIYLDYLLASGYELPPNFTESVKQEKGFTLDLLKFASNSGFVAVSAFNHLMALRKLGHALYPVDDDSHPDALGYEAYAQTLADAINKYCQRNPGC
jgi:hypothetical protein